MPTIRFDKLIDHYPPTHEGTHFHPSATQELTSVLGDVFGILIMALIVGIL